MACRGNCWANARWHCRSIGADTCAGPCTTCSAGLKHTASPIRACWPICKAAAVRTNGHCGVSSSRTGWRGCFHNIWSTAATGSMPGKPASRFSRRRRFPMTHCAIWNAPALRHCGRPSSAGSANIAAVSSVSWRRSWRHRMSRCRRCTCSGWRTCRRRNCRYCGCMRAARRCSCMCPIPAANTGAACTAPSGKDSGSCRKRPSGRTSRTPSAPGWKTRTRSTGTSRAIRCWRAGAAWASTFLQRWSKVNCARTSATGRTRPARRRKTACNACNTASASCSPN